jgi:hypothetical protein
MHRDSEVQSQNGLTKPQNASFLPEIMADLTSSALVFFLPEIAQCTYK